MVFPWRLRDSKSPQVSRTLLSILAVFSNAVVWMVSTRPFNNPLVIVPKVLITIGIIVTFMFHSFFQFSSNVEVLISLFTFFQFYSVVCRDSRVDSFADFLFVFFLLIIIRFGLRAEIRWSVCISKSHRSLCVSFSRTGAGLCIYHLLAYYHYYYYYYYYYHCFSPCEFFIPTSAGGLSLESEWQQVSSRLPDSSEYFSRS